MRKKIKGLEIQNIEPAVLIVPKKRKRGQIKELKEIEDTLGIVEIFGRRVFWGKIGRANYKFITSQTSTTGSDVMVYDMRYGKVTHLKFTKDYRRTCKYYYDWGEIDRLIFKYFVEKNKYRMEKGTYVDVMEMPAHIVEIRNEIIESLFNLVNTIIYTHSFHQQIHDGDLFQDSVIKLISLLDDDKHDPLRGTSFTFFTVALKNMIFTQIKKQKRYVNTLDSGKPIGKRDSNLDDMDGYMEDGGDTLQDLVALYSNTPQIDEECPMEEAAEEDTKE